MNGYHFLVLSWAVYFFIHSLLAGTPVKSFFHHHLGKGFKFYRIAYSTISVMGLLVLLVMNASLRGNYLFSNDGFVRYASLIITAVGLLILHPAFGQYSLKEFLGFKQYGEGEKLRKGGILGIIRHPLYTATILITIGFFLFNPTAGTAIAAFCVFIYLPIGIMLEEKKLIDSFGEEYRNYKKNVPALFPWISRRH